MLSSLHLSGSRLSARISLALVTIALFAHAAHLKLVDAVCDPRALQASFAELQQDAMLRITQMNILQRHTFQTVIDCVHCYTQNQSQETPPIFLEGQPGRGKTFVV
ncbi:hypothetical protein DFH94DRAFT_737570 [Russula ochroleuca]|uniref:Uncharacterized protein n=1 Tax=Russula ochroleuca TaxID=152965 RepID=A0A9P5MX94_9AGAM|nr:hypothetical protein DFH94DRAFT_737570 [Russula ochroleuca]